MSQLKFEFSRPLALTDLPDHGAMPFAYDATPTECAALAVRLGVPAVHSVRVEGHARLARGPVSNDSAMRITATVIAQLDQVCVITLEPFATDVNEPFEVLCATELPEDPVVGDDLDIEALLEQDDVELLVEGGVDVGELAAQFLALGLDPNPRKPGVDVPVDYLTNPDGQADERPNPFAELAKLKQKH